MAARAVRQVTDDPGSSQLPLPDGSRAARAESYLRRLAERELRSFAEHPNLPPARSDGLPPLAPAMAVLQRVSAAIPLSWQRLS